MKETSRQHVLAFLDGSGSEGRRLADRYRRDNGLKVKDRCVYCRTEGHYYTCPESDRVAFSCSNFTTKDKKRHDKEEAQRRTEEIRRRGMSW
jgi:hypothetical protein